MSISQTLKLISAITVLFLFSACSTTSFKEYYCTGDENWPEWVQISESEIKELNYRELVEGFYASAHKSEPLINRNKTRKYF